MRFNSHFSTVLATSLLLSPTMVEAQDVHVVTSFSLLADMVEKVGGEQVVVTTLVDVDQDPHTYSPNPRDSASVSSADLVVVNGMGFEGWMQRLIDSSGYDNTVVVASDGIEPLQSEHNGHHIVDPHAWTSAANGSIYAKNIIQALIEVAPQHERYFAERGNQYVQKLDQLDSWAINEFKQIPAERRKVLTSHDSFGYFAQRYNVEFLSPIGLSSNSEASARHIAQLIQQVQQYNITHYFIENQTNSRLVEQIAEATGAKPGGELFPEALTDESGVAPSYAQAFEHNVSVMLNSMQ